MKRALALLLAAAAASCGGGNADAVRAFNERRDLCNGLNAKGETVAQVQQDFLATGLNGPTFAVDNDIACRTDFVLPSGSTCQPGQSVCKIFWQSIGDDSSLCNQGACVYACIAFVSGQTPTDATAASSVVCGTQFVSGQPFFF